MESRTRRRLSGILAAFSAIAAVCAAVAAIASAGRAEQPGVFALLGGTPKIVSTFWAEHAAGLTATLKIRQFQLDGKTPILNYDVDMQKLMHLIVVRDDFATYTHLHPSFDTTTGTFSQPFTKQPDHRYYVYADTTPHGIGQQVFRFTIESDGAVAPIKPATSASSPDAVAGPYTAILAKTTLPANQPQKIDLTIVKGDDPAQDLGTYLGAAAHAVFINTSTLAYVHVHPMVRGAGMAAKAGPFMQLKLPPLPAGIYKSWIQFRGGNDKLYTAAFTTAVR